MNRYFITFFILAITISCNEKKTELKINSEDIHSIKFSSKEPSLVVEKDSNFIKYGFDTVVRVTRSRIDTTVMLNLKDSTIILKDSASQ